MDKKMETIVSGAANCSHLLDNSLSVQVWEVTTTRPALSSFCFEVKLASVKSSSELALVSQLGETLRRRCSNNAAFWGVCCALNGETFFTVSDLLNSVSKSC